MIWVCVELFSYFLYDHASRSRDGLALFGTCFSLFLFRTCRLQCSLSCSHHTMLLIQTNKDERSRSENDPQSHFVIAQEMAFFVRARSFVDWCSKRYLPDRYRCICYQTIYSPVYSSGIDNSQINYDETMKINDTDRMKQRPIADILHRYIS